ncbi:MAG TPA: DUF6252 family protein [Chitinophagaceae bacterium]
MKIINFIVLISAVLFLSKCKKDNPSNSTLRTCNPVSDGIFSATINNEPWIACNYKAVYYTKDKVLSMTAIDQNSNIELRFFITLDTILQLKTYTINSNENNGLEIVQTIMNGNSSGEDIYFCDLISPTTGGTITISKLDTLTGKISGTFNVTGYSRDQHETMTLTNGLLNDVKLVKSSLSYFDGSYISSNINGTNWYANGVFSKVTLYIGSPLYSFLEVRAMGYPEDLGECPQYLSSYSRNIFWAGGRNFVFNIPLSQGTGTYPLQPSNMYNQTISSQHYLFSYNHHDFDNRYYPLLGSNITLTSLDTAHRNLDAIFTTQVQDSRGNNINLTTGKIHIRNWQPL